MPYLPAQQPKIINDEIRQLRRLRQYIPVVKYDGPGAAAKRILDFTVAFLLLLLLAPLMISIAIIVKLTSPGPVLFCQYRVGKGGKLFRFYKFRSMVTNAEALKATLHHQNEKDGPIFKMRKDPRITPIGKWLRRYSLDELPQIINVLFNDMSLVGPRPPVPSEVIRYKQWQLRRLSVTPGLTCIWQTSGRSQLSFDEWMQMDLAYIDNWSLALDLKLLIKTIKTVLTADGAY